MKSHISIICLACMLVLGCSRKNEATSEGTDSTSASPRTASDSVKKSQKSVATTTLTAEQQATLKAAGGGFKTYLEQANGLVSAIKGNQSAESIAKLGSILTQTGVGLAPAVLVRFPQCKPYLDAVVAASGTMHTLPLKEIDSGYHEDGKLPKNTQGECYHAKDLVVHPATVVALANSGLADRAAAENEIAEVLTHLGQLRASLKLAE